MAMNSSISTLAGSVFNNQASPYIAGRSSVTYALWFGLMICEISLIATLLVVYIERRAENTNKARLRSCGDMDLEEHAGISLKDLLHFKPAFWILSLSGLAVYGCVMPFNNIASSLIMERNYFKLPPQECTRCGVGAYEHWEPCTQIVPKCPHSPSFSWPLPKLSANCTITIPQDQLNCTTIEPWIGASSIDCSNTAWNLGPKTFMYCKSQKHAVAAANIPMSIPYTIASIVSPVFGIMIDKFGMRALLAIVAPAILVGVHLTLAWSDMNIWVPLMFQGIAYSFYTAASSASVPDIVDENHIGTAYGVMAAFTNLGLSIFPILVAGVYDASGQTYIPNVELLFAAFALVGLLFGIALNFVDYLNGWRLNCPKRQQRDQDQYQDDKHVEFVTLLHLHPLH